MTSLPASMPGPPSSSDRTAAKRRAALVWKVMTQAYGRAWDREMGPVPTPTWVRALADISDAEVARGLGEIAKGTRKYLPNLGEFTALCRPASEEQRAFDARSEQHHAPLPTLAELASTSLTGKAWFAFMQLKGLVPKRRSDEELVADIGAAGLTVEAMQAMHDAELARARRRFEDG